MVVVVEVVAMALGPIQAAARRSDDLRHSHLPQISPPLDKASLKLKWIYDKIACCEPINDFIKKLEALYHVPVVQILAASNRFGRNLSFS